jgi:hypothetical protein
VKWQILLTLPKARSVRFNYTLKAEKPLLERVLSDLWVSTI